MRRFGATVSPPEDEDDAEDEDDEDEVSDDDTGAAAEDDDDDDEESETGAAEANMCSTGEPEPDSGVPLTSWWYSLREAAERVAISLFARKGEGASERM